MKTKVLIIGSGVRTQGAIIPALRCLAETHECIGITGRTKKTITYGENVSYEVSDALDGALVASADIIMVAVSKSNVGQVLKKLSQFDTSRAVLMLDTPVLPLTGLLAARFFFRFKKVLVSEDVIALPPFLLARNLIDEGRIGKLQSLYLFHNG